MKRSLFLFLLLSCILSYTSCIEDKAEDAAHRLTVNKINIEVIQTGALSTGNRATLDIIANRGYSISSDADWLSVDKPTGQGRVTTTLFVKSNETSKVRKGYLTIQSGDLTEVVCIKQTLEPDTDDNLQIGHIYLSDDFSWCEQFGGDDQVQYPNQGSTQPVRNHAIAKAKFEEMGYAEYNYAGNAFYMAKHYFKMGKTNQQNGLAIDLSKYIARGKSTTAILTFDAAPVISITGSGDAMAIKSIDPTAVTVEVIEGPGTVNNATSAISESILMNSVTSWNQWVSMQVKLNGVTDRTKIVIRSTQFKTNGLYRWYLDNVKITKTSRS